MLIDTHAHIYLDAFAGDRMPMLDRAAKAGVGTILMPAIDVVTIEKAVALAETHENLFAMAALHPSEVKEASDDLMAEVERWCAHPKVVAVGETGLDYYWDRSFDERQQRFLRLHVRLAARVDLPLVLHNREATADLLRILREEKAASPTPERIRGVFHCFGGTEQTAREVLDLGFAIGLGGTLTYKNSGVADAVRDIPMEAIVLETDAPYLAPVPYRGKRNEPAHVRLVAEKLAAVKDIAVEEVARATSENARQMFGL